MFLSQKCPSLLTFLHSKQGYLPDDFSCKNLYCLVLELPSYSPHSSGFWAPSYKRLINRWATLWRKSGLKLIEKKKTDVLKLIIYHTIRVRYILKTWGYKNETDKCALYFQVKTIEHCFLFCPRVHAAWNFFASHLSHLSDCPFPVSSSSVSFPFSCHASSPSFSLYCYTTATVLFWIWQTRNLATFRNSVLSTTQIINLIKRDISCGILCAKQDEKENFWSTGAVLCKITGKNSVFFFPDSCFLYTASYCR